MLTRKITLLLLLFLAQSAFSQQDGYWDKDRATTKEIIVSAGEKIAVKTEDLPIGTTEIVYRITILDENQQMASSLSSLLKAIPDPSGISQGAAGAVFLTSKISGDDKCKYGIFSSNAFAKEYKEKGKTDNACLFQNTAVNKEARRLSIDKSSCLKTGQEYLWFGFESMNWIMKQKIVLEIVPWVDNRLSRGWTLENRQTIIKQIKTSDLAKKMLNSDDFSLCILEKMQKRYKFQEFQNLMAIEKAKALKDFGNTCLSEKPANKSILTSIRLDAMQYFKNKKYEQAIDLLQTGVIENGNATVLDYNALGQYYLYSKQFDKALKALKEGESRDESELLIQLNMAHVYLLKGDYKKAKEIHKKYKGQNVTTTLSWKAKTQFDFEDLKKAGFVNDDFDRILKLLED
ncbi:tetratricopeptide (TPR) repeat protein [Flavobacterium sp. 28YEA47A]|uniref:tetratricopeptide repeat protein n=1 Tax=Flavobacterium sp. 28YEA47A TaxID=3156276 RepID=UPI0035198B6B